MIEQLSHMLKEKFVLVEPKAKNLQEAP